MHECAFACAPHAVHAWTRTLTLIHKSDLFRAPPLARLVGGSPQECHELRVEAVRIPVPLLSRPAVRLQIRLSQILRLTAAFGICVACVGDCDRPLWRPCRWIWTAGRKCGLLNGPTCRRVPMPTPPTPLPSMLPRDAPTTWLPSSSSSLSCHSCMGVQGVQQGMRVNCCQL